jgi:hypothetical protein
VLRLMSTPGIAFGAISIPSAQFRGKAALAPAGK